MDFTSTPSQFIFPVLKSADILLCMAELEIELSKAELSEPHRHKDKIKKVFLILVCTSVSTLVLFGLMEHRHCFLLND